MKNRCEIPEADLKRLKKYIKSVEWRFAKTMPQWPHWYTLDKWNPDKQDEFDFLFRCIGWYGYRDEFNPRDRWYYLQIDEFRYWHCAEHIINRADATKSSKQVREEGLKFKADQSKMTNAKTRPD